jgi:hypothetical protein
VAADGSYGHTGQIPVGSPCRPPPLGSSRSRAENHSPQPRHVPKQVTGPGTTHTEPATGRQQGSQSAKVSLYPSLRRHVLRAGAERPHPEHSTLVLASQQHAGGGPVGLGDYPAASRRGVVGREQAGAFLQRARFHAGQIRETHDSTLLTSQPVVVKLSSDEAGFSAFLFPHRVSPATDGARTRDLL